MSSLARDPDRQPGDVPAAAQSDCGKPIATDDDAAEGEAEELPTEPAEPSESEGRRGPSSTSHAKSNGHGHG